MADARLQQWAYVTDGNSLFEATGRKRVTGAMMACRTEYELEDCRAPDTFVWVAEVVLLGRFELVRAAPAEGLVDATVLV